MVLMVGLGVMLAVGLAVTVRWAGEEYVAWPATDPPTGARGLAAHAAKRYFRGALVVWVAGIWAGGLVTGPAMRLIMRLLAVTAGDSAQGAITEADQVVGKITVGETFGLYVFGGLVPGLASALVWVLLRRSFPRGWLGGVTFGVLHLVLLATRIDPLRSDNIDFDLVGPGWLAVLTFGLAAVVHGVAVAALVNRYSAAMPPPPGLTRRRKVLVVGGPLVLPVLLLGVGGFLLIPIALGGIVAVLIGLVPALGRWASSRPVRVGVSAALAVTALVALPGTVRDLVEIVDRPASVERAIE